MFCTFTEKSCMLEQLISQTHFQLYTLGIAYYPSLCVTIGPEVRHMAAWTRLRQPMGGSRGTHAMYYVELQSLLANIHLDYIITSRYINSVLRLNPCFKHIIKN